jgi:hypothetical protein
MTNRDFFTNITKGILTDAEKEHATNALAKLDATLEARKNKPSKAAVENAPLIDQIVNEVLTTEFKTAADVAAVMDITVQKASSLLRQAVAARLAVVTEVKIPKRGTCKAYALAPKTETETEVEAE